ncbi:MAG: FAD-binding protein [Planctomycetota bacterium]|nr:FAD-binding protein [Planctomycetota bacterium]
MKFTGYLWVGMSTTFNIIANAVTFGWFIWLEGRLRGGSFRNWARRYRYEPKRSESPTTEEELVEIVKRSSKVRVFGSGHSFNTGIRVDGTLVTLDKYNRVLSFDREEKQLTVQAGMRVRDVVSALKERGLAFSALPSHDAQSIAGIISTDVHGTGRDWGFVNESVVRLKLLDGKGVLHECVPTDDLFKAAIGGIGAVGIIIEVTLQAVDRFRVHQKVKIRKLSEVKTELNDLLQTHEHFSLYLFPFTKYCQVNTWDRVESSKSLLAPLREWWSISMDAFTVVWVGNLIAYLGLSRMLSNVAHRFKKGTSLVMESNRAFNRTIYHLHQELEFTVPFERTWEACDAFLELYQDMYMTRALPYVLLEVRFTPGGVDRSLLGAGAVQRSTWIDLVSNDSEGFRRYYDAAELKLMELGARPHLGKWCKTLDAAYMARVHGERYTRFRRLANKHDPAGKFENEFTRRVLGSGPSSAHPTRGGPTPDGANAAGAMGTA